MELTETYTYVTRSNGVGCAAGWQYYLLLYARREGAGVRLRLRLACTSDATFYGYRSTGWVKVNGTAVWQWENQSLPAKDWSASPALTEDGVYYYRYTDLGECVATGSGQLTVEAAWARVESVDPVPRWLPYYKTYANLNCTVQNGSGAELTVLAPAVLGVSSRIRYSGSGETCALRFTLGSWQHTVTVASAGEYTAGLPVEAAYQFPQSVTAAGTVTLLVYRGGAVVESPSAPMEFQLDGAEPDVTLTGLAPVEGFSDIYIKDKSRLTAQVQAAGKLGAWLVSTGFRVEGVDYPSGGVSERLRTPGTLTVTAYGVDSRGREGRATQEVFVWDYTRPALLVHSAFRSDGSGNPTDGGGYLYLQVQGSATALGGRNGYALWWRWKPVGGSYSEEGNLGTAFSGCLGGQFAPQTGYSIQVGIRDTLGEEAVSTIHLPTEAICAHQGKDFLALGMYTQQGGLECRWPARFYGSIYVNDQPLEQYIRSITGG